MEHNKQIIVPRKHRKDKTEVSCAIKYLMFGFNVLFWLVGAVCMAIGLWAWGEKDMFNNIGKLTKISFDPALFFIIIGAVIFIICFAGCIGALRENTGLLLFYCVLVGLIFFAQLLCGVLAFIYKDWVKDQIQTQVKNMIVNYREDVDLQNLIDWVQEDWLYCCGVEFYQDWELNMYFNCSSPGIEACGVPSSCCKMKDGKSFKNTQCGHDMMKKSHDFDRETKIYTAGCMPSGQKWLENNLIVVASITVAIAVVQILLLCFAHNLRSDINAQIAKWRYNRGAL